MKNITVGSRLAQAETVHWSGRPYPWVGASGSDLGAPGLGGGARTRDSEPMLTPTVTELARLSPHRAGARRAPRPPKPPASSTQRT
jgi:hypothetical protein